MSEKEKYLTSIDEKFKNGLKDVNFYFNNINGATEEMAYSELNRMHNSPDIPDEIVLGKYSPK